MLCRPAHFTFLFLAVSAALGQAADLHGEIVIKRKLSRRTVTAPASSYHRGSAVQPPATTTEDPLDYERSRVVVFLEGQFPAEPVTATVEQVNRQFVPDIAVVPAGSTVSFPNRDAIFHNVFSLSKPKTFDLGNYPKGRTRTVTLNQPGVVYVNCHLHPNMSATIMVTPNRWSTRASASGKFRLSDVPPGKHTVVAWHKSVGFFRQTVEVSAGDDASVTFLIPFEAEAPEETASAR